MRHELYNIVSDVRRFGSGPSLDFHQLLETCLPTLPRCDRERASYVLILTREADADADLLAIDLACRGIEAVRLNVETLQRGLTFRWSSTNAAGASFRLINDLELRPEDVSVVVLRHFGLSTLEFSKDEFAQRFLEEQWGAFTLWLREIAPEGWVNSWSGTRRAAERIRQLEVARDVGLEVPRTCITNDLCHAKAFVRSIGGPAVVKVLAHHNIEVRGLVRSVYTRVLDATVFESLRGCGNAPWIFQELVPKSSELRVTVVGESVMASELSPPTKGRDAVDLHRTPCAAVPQRPFLLNDRLAKACRRLIRRFGLRYGTLDFVMTEDRRPVFLELNAAGDWLWVEEATGLKITAEIAAFVAQLVEDAKPVRQNSCHPS